MWRVLLAVGLLAGVGGAAQAPARLQALVVDANGRPVAGAVLTLRQNGNAVATLVSDPAGHARHDALGPGGYQINVDKPGFFTTSVTVTLHAGANHARLVLHTADELQQQVQVTASASPIQTEATTPVPQLDAQEVRDVPIANSHDLLQSLPLLPGVIADNQGAPHLAGARADETSVQLDNFEIGSPDNGSLDARVNVDAVSEMTVEDAPDAAQANAGGGVLALQTQMGSDQFHFQLVNFLPEPVLQEGLRLGDWYPRISWSGPLRRGRAWFSEAFSLQHTLTVVPSLPAGQNLGSQWQADNLTRLQVNLTPNNSLIGDLLWNGSDLGQVGLDALDPVPTTTTAKDGRIFASVLDEGTWAGGLWQAGAGLEGDRMTSTPQGSQLYVEAPDGNSGNYFQTLAQQDSRFQLMASGWLPVSTSWGTQGLRFGFNFDQLGVEQQAVRGPFEVVNASGAPLETASFQGSGEWRVTPRQWGAYAEDEWQIGRRWRIQPQLRVDDDSLAAEALAQPRLSMSFLPTGSDRGKLYASIGLDFEPPAIDIYGQAFDQVRLDQFYDSAGEVASQSTTQFLLPAAPLPAPRFLISTVGWQQRFDTHTFASLVLLDRQERDGWAYIPSGSILVLADERRDLYRAAEVNAQHTFGARIELYADYTRSLDQSNQALDYTLLNPVYSPQAPGPLPTDAPNRIVSWGWMQTNFRLLLLSYALEWHTGFPYNVVNQEQQLVGAPGAQRFPNYASLDLGVERPVRFRNDIWALRLTVVNVTDHNNPTVVIANTGAANFGAFEGSEGRAFTLRLRLIGRAGH